MFAAVEPDALMPLPPRAFESVVLVSGEGRPRTCHVKVGKALYSVPWRHIGCQVDARQGVRTVEVYLDGTLIKAHVRIERGRQTDRADYPPEKIAFFMRTPAWCRLRAGELGDAVVEVTGVIMAVNAIYRLRQAQGIIGLADQSRRPAGCGLSSCPPSR